MKRAERLESILERLSDDGSVAVSELTETLQASAATVRRDLELLEQQKLLSRTHGGAVGNGTLYELPVRYRGGQHAAEKRRIADAAALRVGEARTVGLSGGTTTTEVARRLRGRELTVVTNAVNIASELVVATHHPPRGHGRHRPAPDLRADRPARRRDACRAQPGPRCSSGSTAPRAGA